MYPWQSDEEKKPGKQYNTFSILSKQYVLENVWIFMTKVMCNEYK